MAKINELNLKDEELDLVPDEEIPELTDDFSVLPQPGVFTARLPEDMEDVWGSFEDKKTGAEILSVWFDREHPLTITGDEFDGHYVGDTISFIGVNNQPRPRGKEKHEVSDMQYLIKALEAHLPVEKRSKLTNNSSFAKALMKHAGEEVKFNLSWNAYCNPGKDIRTMQEDGSTKEEPGTEGCGASFYAPSRDKTKEIPKDADGYYMSRFPEGLVPGRSDEDGNPLCPAVLFARGQMNRFKSAHTVDEE